ncbi:NAD(P)H-binding protein [Bacillus inaquosorum]|uniref:NAD(P)-dependent oxidoreductase n=1 Tax=Bacillus inaquosorum TaxID=483913 RepID=UPI002DBEA56D|nr:NAD(P)H-binding protein [Bacillus inaquosorum]MEC0573518.1 NAD(P)H-binding protein [Bacillus inaquosorum]MED1173866.1 NAD(P)H-binding protein [Bacillus inaquosorum]MED1539796.1 NAD(P)H-binding protein [Bacillus inaquosorum]
MTNHSKKIAIIGGTGKAGRFIASQALAKGYQVRMLVRQPERPPHIDERIDVIRGDAQHPQSIRTLLEGCSAVVNTFGQPERAVPLYSTVTELIVTVMKEYNIDRYIGVTGASLDIEGDRKSLVYRIGALLFRLLYPQMIADKKKELHILSRSGLDWTIVRLPFVTDAQTQGAVKVDFFNSPGMRITNLDIAAFLVQQIEDHSFSQKTPFISN